MKPKSSSQPKSKNFANAGQALKDFVNIYDEVN